MRATRGGGGDFGNAVGARTFLSAFSNTALAADRNVRAPFWRRLGDSGLNRQFASARAFTLIELLVVIAILALLATLVLPNLDAFNRGNAMSAATSQLSGDLANARLRAIADHTTVYVVFIPPVNMLPASTPNDLLSGLTQGGGREAMNRLIEGQLVSYTMFSFRSVGDQPGRPTARYRSEWKTLPRGVFIPDWKFLLGPSVHYDIESPSSSFDVDQFERRGILASYPQGAFPYPMVESPVRLPLPYVAFDYQGRLVSFDNDTGEENPVVEDVFIPLATGSLGPPGHDPSGNLLWLVADAKEDPPGNSTNTPNVIRVNKITGRARVEREEIQ